MSGTPKIEHIVAFSSYQTPTVLAKDPVSAPTLIPPNDDITQISPSPNPTPAPIIPYLQPAEKSRPDPHIGPTLIPPHDHVIYPQ